SFFSSRRRHTSWPRDWSSDVCSSDLGPELIRGPVAETQVGVDVDSGVFGAGQHGGNLRLPLRRSVDTLRTLLCDDLHPQRPPKRSEERRVGKDCRTRWTQYQYNIDRV